MAAFAPDSRIPLFGEMDSLVAQGSNRPWACDTARLDKIRKEGP